MAILTDRVNLVVPTLDTDLIGEGILDSLALVDLVMHLEMEFGFTVAVDQLELDNFQTVERIGQMIMRSTVEFPDAVAS
jgi:acyl carrier protein